MGRIGPMALKPRNTMPPLLPCLRSSDHSGSWGSAQSESISRRLFELVMVSHKTLVGSEYHVGEPLILVLELAVFGPFHIPSRIRAILAVGPMFRFVSAHLGKLATNWTISCSERDFCWIQREHVHLSSKVGPCRCQKRDEYHQEAQPKTETRSGEKSQSSMS
jgi:hypothetical protein